MEMLDNLHREKSELRRMNYGITIEREIGSNLFLNNFGG
jgi:hypothetical protein